jgi:1-acyl-sn-glycerol-3-phosphate acyltransferase
MVGVFGGLFIVPLYAFVQLRSAPERQSQVISANNVLNAVFMVSAAGMSGVLLSAGMDVPGLILVCAVLNALVALYIYRTVPEFLWRFVSWVIVHSIYRVKTTGHENVPEQGAALIAPNHVSYIDALVLSAISPRPIRFVMDANIFKVPVLSWLFRQVNAIPIASAKDDPEVLAKALAAVHQALENDELVCVFPEGELTRDGSLGVFKPGIRKMLDLCPVSVIPVGLQGLWDSPFSRNGTSFVRSLQTLGLRWGLMFR